MTATQVEHGGVGANTMTAPNAITQIQDAYVEKMIDTVNDLPNVLWIVSEEANAKTLWWNDHLIEHVRAYESGKPHQHPIGYAAPIGVWDRAVYNSNADWVAPAALVSPASSCGTGKPPCKVNINDSDHSYFGMWNDTAQENRNYEWENFTTGNQVLFMDPYLVYYPRENRNLCVAPSEEICASPDKRYEDFRDNLGYILKYSRKLSLVNVTPNDRLSSTGYCLAQTPPIGAEYLVYAPAGGQFTVDLSAMPSSPDAGRRMVQSLDWRGDNRKCRRRRLCFPDIYPTFQRRRSALSGRYRGTRHLGHALT